MKHMVLGLSLLLTSFLSMPAQAAERLGNVQPEATVPKGDLYFIWPDGQRIPAVPRSDGRIVLPDGSIPQGEVQLLFPDGQAVPMQPDGKVELPYMPEKDQTIIQPKETPAGQPEADVVNPEPGKEESGRPLSESELHLLKQGIPLHEQPDGTRVPLKIEPDGTVTLPDDVAPHQEIKVILPDGSIVSLPPGSKLDLSKHGVRPSPKQEAQPSLASLVPVTPVPPAKSPAVKEPVQEAPQEQGTLAALLPKSDISELTAGMEPQAEKKQPPVQKEQRGKESPVPAMQEKQPETRPSKPKPGDELRIPPEAVKSGKLDFLEGCWQGTRPEYYSKRMVKECFCFNKDGRSGKRRIIDRGGSRTCIGATSASMSSSGVLQVTSEGAYCNDGERWGAANMTCRGSGKKTPCSWIFTDAAGGRQAYEIPFVRVTSCGR